MSTTFPRTRSSKKGYSVDEVEEFLEEARKAYTADQPGSQVTAAAIRHMAFSMEKGGYSPTHVDAALERLEDAFATRERARAFAEQGDQAWFDRARAQAQEILDRLDRPDGRKFQRVGFLTAGYDPKEVDAAAARLADYFQNGKPMSPDQVRTLVFRSKRGGYAEWQVDLLLDAVTDVMLAVR